MCLVHHEHVACFAELLFDCGGLAGPACTRLEEDLKLSLKVSVKEPGASGGGARKS